MSTPGEREVWLRGQREALEAAVNGAPPQTSLAALARAVVDGLGRDTRSAFYLANREGTSLHHVVGMPAAYAEAVEGFQIGPESLACGLAVHSGHAVITSDVTKEARWEPWRWLAQRFDFRGCWSFPIRTSLGGGEVHRHIGGLFAAATRGDGARSGVHLACDPHRLYHHLAAYGVGGAQAR